MRSQSFVLGEGAINPLAVDGKGGKADLLEAVARWVAARGRNVVQPGKYKAFLHEIILTRLV